MVLDNILRRCNLAQWRSLYRCHTKIAFILLLTISLSTIFDVPDFSLKASMYNYTWFTKVSNQTLSVVGIDNFLAKTNPVVLLASTSNQQVQERTTAASVLYHVAHPHNYHFILDEPDKCLQQNPFLVLMVPVAPHQLKARNAIRSTWGNETNIQGKAVMTLFMVGLPSGPDIEKTHQELREESRQHGDLLQSNFMDTYVNLTIKTMVIMDWLATRCPQASYGMKVDSDMFLNMENLISLLLAPKTPKQNYIIGRVMRNLPVNRNKKSKWYVPVELYPEPNYPVYLLGMGYIFSNDLPKKFIEASKDIQPFNIEDAYVGACLKRLGIPPSRPLDPSQFRTFIHKYKREEFLRVITTILSSPQQLIEFWQDVKRPTPKFIANNTRPEEIHILKVTMKTPLKNKPQS